jgi:hypothetical protein
MNFRLLRCCCALTLILLAAGCVEQKQDMCKDFAASAEKQLSDTSFKGRFHYAIDDYEKAAKCYVREGKNETARTYWTLVVDTYMLENQRELDAGSLTSAGKCNFYAAYYSLAKLGDRQAAQRYANAAVGYYDQINETGFRYYGAKAIATNNATYLTMVEPMVELLGDENLKTIQNDIRKNI